MSAGAATDTRIAEIEARWAKATKGPLLVTRVAAEGGFFDYRLISDSEAVAVFPEFTRAEGRALEALLDARAHGYAEHDVAFLLARVRELEAQVSASTGPVKCPRCSREFANAHGLAIHMAWHRKLEPYVPGARR